ncbi:glycine N-acyltransferase-like protein 3 [Pseudoliparis swirei]|uniref:glycine N-acyltransferase-like protein 3 n=1 Tax=Pseudoliparis swirei TaxID=2059687 RepID=UPI0024BD895D|nr:glycine N-acyltransferase-like protein 3 [Pseudoliparis swirei]
MKILNKAELQIAEGVLLKHLPKSFMVYGFIYGINRKKPSTLEVIVDTWPDFKVIICRPDPKRVLEFMKNVVYYYTLDDQMLRKMLREENSVDWSTHFVIAALDVSHANMIKEVSSDREVNNRVYSLVHLMYLPDSSHLPPPTADSELESRISPLNLSHVDLVNKTWKFGGNQQSRINIKNLISNFPSCCITDGQGQPVSWILMNDYCALGLLHTLPEYRGRGYAKALVNTIVRRLHSEGYPVYCFIEEDNAVSFELFKSLGFIEDPSYRATWLELNF